MTSALMTERVLPSPLWQLPVFDEGERIAQQRDHYDEQSMTLLDEWGSAVASALLLALDQGWIPAYRIEAALVSPRETVDLFNEIMDRVGTDLTTRQSRWWPEEPRYVVAQLEFDGSGWLMCNTSACYIENDWRFLPDELAQALYAASFALASEVAPASLSDSTFSPYPVLGEAIETFTQLHSRGVFNDLEQAWNNNDLPELLGEELWWYFESEYDSHTVEAFTEFVEQFRTWTFQPEWMNEPLHTMPRPVLVERLLRDLARWRGKGYEDIRAYPHFRWLRQSVLLLRRFHRDYPKGLPEREVDRGYYGDDGDVPFELGLYVATGHGADEIMAQAQFETLGQSGDRPVERYCFDETHPSEMLDQLRYLCEGLGLWESLAHLQAS